MTEFLTAELFLHWEGSELSAEEGPNGPRFVKFRRQTVGAGPYRGEIGWVGSSISIAASSAT